jgi:hypothetical protein
MVVPAHLRESVGTNGEKVVLQCFFFGLMSLSNLGPTCYFRKETDSNRGHRVRLQGNRALCSLTLFVIVFPVVTLQRISVKIYLSRVFLFPYWDVALTHNKIQNQNVKTKKEMHTSLNIYQKKWRLVCILEDSSSSELAEFFQIPHWHVSTWARERSLEIDSMVWGGE